MPRPSATLFSGARGSKITRNGSEVHSGSSGQKNRDAKSKTSLSGIKKAVSNFSNSFETASFTQKENLIFFFTAYILT